jgi:hypothetical protein
MRVLGFFPPSGDLERHWQVRPVDLNGLCNGGYRSQYSMKMARSQPLYHSPGTRATKCWTCTLFGAIFRNHAVQNAAMPPQNIAIVLNFSQDTLLGRHDRVHNMEFLNCPSRALITMHTRTLAGLSRLQRCKGEEKSTGECLPCGEDGQRRAVDVATNGVVRVAVRFKFILRMRSPIPHPTNAPPHKHAPPAHMPHLATRTAARARGGGCAR